MRLLRVNVALIVLVMLAPTVAGCDHNSRQKTLRTSLIAVNVARDGFETWEDTRQDQIIAAATTKEEGQRKLAEFRAELDKIYAALPTVYSAIAVASLHKDEHSLQVALEEAGKLFAAIKKLKGEL